MKATLAEFHRLRPIFEDVGVRPDGFSLPRQHALVHYVRAIQLFGSPNGLCSSITESRHITVVKRPWRWSNRRQALGQILKTLVRLSQLAALRVDLARRGVLSGSVYHHALRGADLEDGPDPDRVIDERYREEADAAPAAEPYSDSTSIRLAASPGKPGLHIFVAHVLTHPFWISAYARRLEQLVVELEQPDLGTHLRRYLYDHLYPELEPAVDVPLDVCPEISLRTRLSLYRSARAVFYAPSEAAGVGGMHQEYIRCVPSWYGGPGRYDTVLVQINPDEPGMLGITVARVRALFSFVYDNHRHECALVDWFEVDGDEPDSVTGMWIVKPEANGGQRVSGVIPLGSIARGCLLSPVYGQTRIPKGSNHSHSLDAFRRYYVNWFADCHAHETIV